MFLVSHDILLFILPVSLFSQLVSFDLGWSTMSRNTETRNYVCVQFAEVFSEIFQFLDKNNVKVVNFGVMFSS